MGEVVSRELEPKLMAFLDLLLGTYWVYAANHNTPTRCFIDFPMATETLNDLNLKCCFFDSILEKK